MAVGTQAAEAANPQVDIIGHILDQKTLELPFVDPHHLLAGEVALPSIEIFGLDMSITRHVVMMWVASFLLVVLMVKAFRKPDGVPSGFANFFEAIVIFLRDEVVLPIMGEDGKKYLPFLLTIFFFVLFCNLLGLIPYCATATGNISVTAGLAICTFLVMIGSGMANNGFFGFFMDMHVHSSVSTDIIVERQIVEHRTDTNENVVKTNSGFQELYFIDKRPNNEPPLYHPLNHYFNPFLSSLYLRGPPSLG